jgi:hypothetical protein
LGVELAVNAQMQGDVEGGRLLCDVGLGGLGFFLRNLGADRAVSGPSGVSDVVGAHGVNVARCHTSVGAMSEDRSRGRSRHRPAAASFPCHSEVGLELRQAVGHLGVGGGEPPHRVGVGQDRERLEVLRRDQDGGRPCTVTVTRSCWPPTRPTTSDR